MKLVKNSSVKFAPTASAYDEGEQNGELLQSRFITMYHQRNMYLIVDML
ncbi:hypothetical protein JFL43_02870 [Viridibacillus sp. YIM B01967]|uniref:Uncharacterized protein n=1 Tax=Viridibacillus soli TaxID=2798301 RepID=A0ABS1H339_9BACL|nr:hypothetical protein [Viridibacillus soli]MBK3493817.1 hypothetical protein [Viridibacillus soli]